MYTIYFIKFYLSTFWVYTRIFSYFMLKILQKWMLYVYSFFDDYPLLLKSHNIKLSKTFLIKQKGFISNYKEVNFIFKSTKWHQNTRWIKIGICYSKFDVIEKDKSLRYVINFFRKIWDFLREKKTHIKNVCNTKQNE